MHIAMFSWEYPPHLVGGLGKHVLDLLPALALEPDITVSLITPMLKSGQQHEALSPQVQVFRVPLPTLDDHDFFAFGQQANKALAQAAETLFHDADGFDLIHNHDWLTAAAAIDLQQRLSLPMVTTIHSTEHGRTQGNLASDYAMRIDHVEHWLTAEAQRVIVCSHYMAGQVAELFHTDSHKIDVVPNAVYLTPNPFNSDMERLAFRRAFVPDDEVLIFFIGRIVYEKGLHVLLDAWRQALGQVRGRLVVAGRGPLAAMYQEQADALGIGDFVTFTGPISDLERDQLYHTADAAVFPSLYEPFGIVALEAMAARCPVIVTQTGGLQEIVRPHETGITVLPNHIDSLTWGLLHTLHNPIWSQVRAHNALDDLVTLYSWQQVARQHAVLYNRVLTGAQAIETLEPSYEPVLVEARHSDRDIR